MTDRPIDPTDRPAVDAQGDRSTAPIDRDPFAGDPDLARDAARTDRLIKVYNYAVIAASVDGQVMGLIDRYHVGRLSAALIVAGLDLGGIVTYAYVDVRRRLGESATAMRLVSVAVACASAAVNWMGHTGVLQVAFPVLGLFGYVLVVSRTEARRRDRRRAKGHGDPIVPSYELVGHWLAHPWLTRRARSIAKRVIEAGGELARYESFEQARSERDRERRNAALTARLREQLGANADLADAVYDPDVIAAVMRSKADNPAVADALMVDLSTEAVTRPKTARRSVADRKPVATDRPTAAQATDSTDGTGDRPTERPTARVTDRRPTRPTVPAPRRPIRQTTARTVDDRSPNWAARENARLLHTRYYPHGLPDGESIGRVRAATGWSFERARDAIDAYRAGVHLADDEPERAVS